MNQLHIQKQFQQRYDQSKWKEFLANTFSDARLLSTPEVLAGINTDVATEALHLGYIVLNEDGIDRNIAIYDVTLAPGIVLERNRVGLRNLLRKYWKDIDGAFVVFHRDDNPNWRFTYVSELKGFDADGEWMDIKTEPKRYTYVLGEAESCKTAAERFAIVAQKGSSTTLDDIKEAFSVEKLSKSFFEDYKTHYEIFCDYMVSQPSIYRSIFDGDDKTVRDFSKKMLGRIVFLYFIQKKGWLGVPEDKTWGDGDLNYLSKLFNQCSHKQLFYSEYLCKLFFNTLNTPRTNDIAEIIPGEKIKIPFLNGGLFEEDNSKYRNLIFPVDLFSDLFDFFNQYNFTIYEDDPNDQTVAVDPEMLGHIFENLLEDNKDKGAFYTPKEIVHYMCQESLIEYLTTYFEGKGYEVISYAGFDKPNQPELFPINEGRKGQLSLEATSGSITKKIDRILIEKLLKQKLDDADKKLVLKHAKEFNTALDKVKICDPAIGSGAFPMGLLKEIFNAKQTIHTFEHGNTKNFDASQVKLDIIQNSIYGVDIEKGAVDIARLRFWLSLVVDEETPKALPNLDYKIVVGNSLVSKLGDDIIDIDWTIDKNQHGLFGAQLAQQKTELLKNLSKEQKEFFNPCSDKKKQASIIRNLKINLLISQLKLMVETMGIETQPRGNDKNIVRQTERYMETTSWKSHIMKLQKLQIQSEKKLNFFDWKLDFPEVMNAEVSEKIGFDIVIANPPYVNIANISDIAYREYIRNKYITVKNKSDLYSVFIEKSHVLSKKMGAVCFIYPKTWMGSDSFSKYREFVISNFKIINIVNLGYGIFENATVSTVISLFRKEKVINNDIFLYQIDRNHIGQINFKLQKNILSYNQIKSTPQNFFSFTKQVPIRIKTTSLGQLIDFSLGIKTSNDKKFIINYKKDDDTYLMLRGKNIRKYEHDKPIEYIWYKPNLMKKKVGAGPRRLEYFTQEKILIQGICNGNLRCSLDNENILVNDKVHVAFNPKKFSLKTILAILNSNLMSFISRATFGNYLEIKINQLLLLPFPSSIDKQLELILNKKVAERINSSSNIKSNLLERDIDNLVYLLYDLSYEEVKVIDPEFGLSEEEYRGFKIEQGSKCLNR